MAEIDLKALLSQPVFLEEVHRLFWIKPFINRGQTDFGWSCRDHAMTLGMVAAMLGHRVQLVMGHATFVQGPTGGGRPLGIEQNPHFWFKSETEGSFDASWRLEKVRNLPQWRPWQSAGIFGAQVSPHGRASYYSTRDAAMYSRMVGAATHQEDQRTAIYLAKRFEPLTLDLVTAQYAWVNSPLTDRIRKIGPALYSAAALHLLEVLEGAPCLGSLDQIELWKELHLRHPDGMAQTILRMQPYARETCIA